MSDKKHTKHTSLVKPKGGSFHVNEWMLFGAPCSYIDELANSLTIALQDKLSVGYLDAAHTEQSADDAFESKLVQSPNFQSYRFKQFPQQKQERKYFSRNDLLFINGNHFQGQRQLLIIDERKKESLSKKLDRLTNVALILVDSSKDEIYNFLQSFDGVPVLRKDDIKSISDFLVAHRNANLPTLKGLVLAGGKSQRMGEDKGQLQYHGKAQSVHEADLLSDFCDGTFISSATKLTSGKTNYKHIVDTFIGLGPYGGILSAFREDPNAAWLSLACDLPYLSKSTLSQLVTSRNPSKLATCFYNPETDFPEPLITIWEPKAYPVLLEFLAQGYSCPRKVLINSDIEMITMDRVIEMKNANTPDEREEAIRFLTSDQTK